LWLDCHHGSSLSNLWDDDQWGEAFMAQPMGLVLCILTAMVVVGGLVVALTGAPLGRLLSTAWNRWWTWGLILMVVAAWGWKVAVHRGVV